MSKPEDRAKKTIDEATILDLIAELGARCPVVVIGYIRPDNKNGETLLRYHGGIVACLGLVELLKSSVLRDGISSMTTRQGD